MHPTNSCVGKALPSTIKHDDGHIHRASLIRGLPPEHRKPATVRFDWPDNLHKLTTGTKTTQQGLIEHPVDNNATMQLAQSNGNRDIDDGTFSHQDKVLTSPTPPNASKGPAVVRQAMDEWFNYNHWLKPAMMTTQPSKLQAPPVGTALTGTDEETTSRPPPCAPLSTVEPKISIKRFSWMAGFLTPWNTVQPKKNQVLQSPNSNSQSRVATN